MREKITDLTPNENYQVSHSQQEDKKTPIKKTKALHLKFLMIMLAGLLGTSVGFMLADLIVNGQLEFKSTDIAKVVKSIKIFR